MELRSRDFRQYLQEELVLRCQKNPAYSLRAFAKALDVSPSFLSKILNGHRPVTEKTFRKMTQLIGVSSEYFFNQKKNENGWWSNDAQSEYQFNHLQLEYFKVISDWYHYAILELTHLPEFQNSPAWIAARLGLKVNQAKSAIERLLDLGLLKEDEGKLRPTNQGNTTTKNEFTALAFKKMQSDLLEMSQKALWNERLDLRDHTSICMAINRQDIFEAKKILTKFRREFCQFLERPGRGVANDVYNLSLSFFSLIHHKNQDDQKDL